MYTIEIYNKMKCSIEEKLEIFDTIDELLELSNLSEELGISILEEAELLESTSIIDIKECQKRVLKILNQLVTEGEINITKGA